MKTIKLKTYGNHYEKFPEELIETLECDNCGKVFGYVYACDLNDSYFYCTDCIKKAKNSNN